MTREFDFADFSKHTDTFRPPDLLGQLSDNEFATLLRETKRFAETRWSPRMRRFDVEDKHGTAPSVHLSQVWNRDRPKISIYASDSKGLGKEWKENHCED